MHPPPLFDAWFLVSSPLQAYKGSFQGRNETHNVATMDVPHFSCFLFIKPAANQPPKARKARRRMKQSIVTSLAIWPAVRHPHFRWKMSLHRGITYRCHKVVLQLFIHQTKKFPIPRRLDLKQRGIGVMVTCLIPNQALALDPKSSAGGSIPSCLTHAFFR